MTESEWLVSEDPQKMLAFLRGHGGVSDRKYRLFACGCCRRIWDRFPHQVNRNLVAMVEDHPEGRFADPDLHEALVASSRCEWECRDTPAYWAAKYLGRGFYKMSAAWSAAIVACKAMSLHDREYGLAVESELFQERLRGEADAVTPRLMPPVPETVSTEAICQARLLSDLFGNVFRPLSSAPGWLTSSAVALAAAMYDSRDFGSMPVLADCLEESGCDDHDILRHCRQEGAHVRGCWVVDMVLGKT